MVVERDDRLEESIYSINSITDWLYFNIHNLVRMRITASHPCAYSIGDEYECFRVSNLEECNLTLSERMLLPAESSDASTVYRFDHSCTRINSLMIDIAVFGEEVFLSGKRDLLPFISPLIQWITSTRRAAFLHAASMAIDNQGILMPAWGGTGKTSAIIELLKLPGSAFMGDDYTIICDDGTLLSYPKPFFIYPYHKDIFPHLFRNKPKLLIPVWFGKPMAVIRQAVRPGLTMFPRLESVCRRLTPEHMKIPARKALPYAKFVDGVPLKLILFVERYSGSEVVVDKLDPILARHRVVGNWYFETGDLARQLMLACGATGLFSLEDWFAKMSSVVDEVFGRFPICRLRIPPMAPALTAKTIASYVSSLLREL